MAALTINTTLIGQQQAQRYVDAEISRRLHATIFHDVAQSCLQHRATTNQRIQCLLHPQAHLDKSIEVVHDLNKQQPPETTLQLSESLATTATRTLVSSLGRRSTLATTSGESRSLISGCSSVNVDWGRSCSGSVIERLRDEPSCVVWNVQLGVVDVDCRPAKRQRGNELVPEAKQFKGVRYRPDRKTWAAEMKPPKYKNKVSFGEFKSQAQAARVVDAAFHYYGKPHLLNFPDSTPEALAAKPTPAGLDEKELLGFVKEQAKRLASSIPPTNSVPSGRTITDYSSSQGIMCVHYHLVSPVLPMPPSSSDCQQDLQEQRSE